jgi:glucan 1,3-beta-glucosidase
MRVTSVALTLSLLASANAQIFQIPHVERISAQVLRHFSKYVKYNGPTAEALAAVNKAGKQQTQVSQSTQADASYWLADIKHQGLAAFNSDPSNYTVFRNVMDYGAKGECLSCSVDGQN